MTPNQNPEQIARDAIDAQVVAAGWAVQSKDAIDFHAGQGQAVREYLTEQQEIVRLLVEQFEAIERNKRELDGALRKSEALRQSILHRAFTGRLVPQDSTDEPASALLARLRAERATSSSKPSRNKPNLA